MSNDTTYCHGIRCLLRENCKRYLQGLAAISDGNDRWMDHCNDENRECYIKN